MHGKILMWQTGNPGTNSDAEIHFLVFCLFILNLNLNAFTKDFHTILFTFCYLTPFSFLCGYLA